MTRTYDYNQILKHILADGEEHISDKEAGVRLGVSERQIRNAKEKMDAYLADRLCASGLGIHPSAVFGHDQWFGAAGDVEFEAELEAEATASEKKRRRRKATA